MKKPYKILAGIITIAVATVIVLLFIDKDKDKPQSLNWELLDEGFSIDDGKPDINGVLEIDPTNADLGILQIGDTVSFSFTASNILDGPVAITDAIASCGCTSVEYDNGPISPGEAIEVKVTYVAEGYGKFVKEVALFTVGSDKPVSMLITGEVSK